MEKKFRLTFTEGLLGTASANPELYEEFIVSKHPQKPQDDECESLKTPEEEIENGTTIFSRDENGNPHLWDYQIKGFFKDAQGCLNRITKMPAYKKIIDGLVFVNERKIPLKLAGEMTFCERTLRVQTPQGERVALARSEEAPTGTTIEFTVKVLDKKLMAKVIEWLEYGALRGLGQWRNSGKGRFKFEELG